MKRLGLNSGKKPIAFIIILIVAMLLASLGACTQSSPTNFTIQVGAETASKGLEISAFLPNYLTVNVGDTVTFTQKTHEPHTITFNAPSPLPDTFLNQRMGTVVANPLVWLPTPAGPLATPGTPVALSASFDGATYINSGVIQTPGDTFKVTFTKPGAYQFVCLLHPSGMSGTIVVQPASSSHFQSQPDIDFEVEQALLDYANSVSGFVTNIIAPGVTANADGTHTYTVFAGAGDETQGFDFMYFFGGVDLTIKAGDKVTWTLEKNMPGMIHTITFLSGEKEPDFIISQPQSPGIPQLIVNPAVSASSPVPSVPYAGTGYFNSGLLIAGGSPQSYTLTFTKPGKYDYICVPHDSTGMKGTINVTP